MVEHVDITDPEIHEPKGVSTASADQVYEADGCWFRCLVRWTTAMRVWRASNLKTQDSDGVSVSSIGTTAQDFPVFSSNGESNGIDKQTPANNQNDCMPYTGKYFVSFTISFENYCCSRRRWYLRIYSHAINGDS